MTNLVGDIIGADAIWETGWQERFIKPLNKRETSTCFYFLDISSRFFSEHMKEAPAEDSLYRCSITTVPQVSFKINGDFDVSF